MKRLVATASLAAALVLSAAPAHADTPIVWTEECPSGMVGRMIHIGDNISTRTCYRLP